MLASNNELRLEIEEIKKKLHNQNQNLEIVFEYLDELIEKKLFRSRESILDIKFRNLIHSILLESL